MAVPRRRNTVKYSSQVTPRVVSKGTASKPKKTTPQKGRFRPDSSKPDFVRVQSQVAP